MTYTLYNYSSIHFCICHFLLASLPLFVISAIGIFSCRKEQYPNNITMAKMAFKKGFIHLLKLSLKKDVFQLCQGAYAPFAFVLDNFILLFPDKVFADVNP